MEKEVRTVEELFFTECFYIMKYVFCNFLLLLFIGSNSKETE